MLTFINCTIWTVWKLLMLFLQRCTVLIQHLWRLYIIKFRSAKRWHCGNAFYFFLYSIWIVKHTESLVTKLIVKSTFIMQGVVGIQVTQLNGTRMRTSLIPFAWEKSVNSNDWILGTGKEVDIVTNKSGTCMLSSLFHLRTGGGLANTAVLNYSGCKRCLLCSCTGVLWYSLRNWFLHMWGACV